MEPWILGFDIGGTKTAAVAGSPDGNILERTQFHSHPERGFAAMWDDIRRAGEEILAGKPSPLAIGVSVGGPLDSERGIVYSPPNLPGWDAIPLRKRLEEAFHVPAYVEHDAKASALAEWRFGAARGAQDVVFLTFGTGLGAGLILGGRLYRGASDSAGEVGHWRIAQDGPALYDKAGSWEGYSSGAGIAALAHLRFPDRFAETVTSHEVVDLARNGNGPALAVIDEAARSLGAGIALLVDLLNPGVVVLGSLAVRAGDLFLPIVDDVLRHECTPRAYSACRIVPAALGNALGDVAAICAALYRIDMADAGDSGR